MAFPLYNPTRDPIASALNALTYKYAASDAWGAMKVRSRVDQARVEACNRRSNVPVPMPPPKVHYTLSLSISSGGGEYWSLKQLGFDPHPTPALHYPTSGGAIRAKAKMVGGVWYKDGAHDRYLPPPLSRWLDTFPGDMTSSELERLIAAKPYNPPVNVMPPDAPLEPGDY